MLSDALLDGRRSERWLFFANKHRSPRQRFRSSSKGHRPFGGDPRRCANLLCSIRSTWLELKQNQIVCAGYRLKILMKVVSKLHLWKYTRHADCTYCQQTLFLLVLIRKTTHPAWNRVAIRWSGARYPNYLSTHRHGDRKSSDQEFVELRSSLVSILISPELPRHLNRVAAIRWRTCCMCRCHMLTELQCASLSRNRMVRTFTFTTRYYNKYEQILDLACT
jgi:hypothetical protein